MEDTKAELDEMRRAWAILGELDEVRSRAYTATEAAHAFVALLKEARAERDAIAPEAAMLREALGVAARMAHVVKTEGTACACERCATVRAALASPSRAAEWFKEREDNIRAEMRMAFDSLPNRGAEMREEGAAVGRAEAWFQATEKVLGTRECGEGSILFVPLKVRDDRVRHVTLEEAAKHFETVPHHVAHNFMKVSFGQIAADTLRALAARAPEKVYVVRKGEIVHRGIPGYASGPVCKNAETRDTLTDDEALVNCPACIRAQEQKSGVVPTRRRCPACSAECDLSSCDCASDCPDIVRKAHHDSAATTKTVEMFAVPSGIRWGSCAECGGVPYHDFDPSRGCCAYDAEALVHGGTGRRR